MLKEFKKISKIKELKKSSTLYFSFNFYNIRMFEISFFFCSFIILSILSNFGSTVHVLFLQVILIVVYR